MTYFSLASYSPFDSIMNSNEWLGFFSPNFFVLAIRTFVIAFSFSKLGSRFLFPYGYHVNFSRRVCVLALSIQYLFVIIRLLYQLVVNRIEKLFVFFYLDAIR